MNHNGNLWQGYFKRTFPDYSLINKFSSEKVLLIKISIKVKHKSERKLLNKRFVLHNHLHFLFPYLFSILLFTTNSNKLETHSSLFIYPAKYKSSVPKSKCITSSFDGSFAMLK